MSTRNVFKTITSERPNMSKAQVKIANYILENPHSVPFLTGSKLAKMAGVSEATVVRFATFLGYKGYNEFQQHLMKSAERQLNTVERLKMSRAVYDETEKTIYDIFQDDINNIKSTMQNLNLDDFKKAANYLLNAERIYIIANRSAVSLGTFLQYYLDIIFGNSELIHTTASAFDRIYNVNENDVVIGVSFARYTKSTIDIASYAYEKNATVIALTDNFTSPITAYADVSLFSSSQMPSFIDSFTAPLSLINTLIAYIGNKEQIDGRLENLEKLWDRYHVFHLDE
ncbi:MAG TPA: MurR/RpiR family transcriptional regulator [Virgibacillus sp.]|nr:MurR/RpiR family transcriptional regulator [Virgibacillus sp.]